MQLGLSGRQSVDAAILRMAQSLNTGAAEAKTGAEAAGRNSGLSNSLEDALNRANERISRAIADGLRPDPGAADLGEPAGNVDEAAAPAIRPLLQGLIERHDDLSKVLDAFAAVDPIRFKPERLVALLEEALSDVEQALDSGTTTPDVSPPKSTLVQPSVIDLVAKPDLAPELAPVELFTNPATSIRRPGALRLVALASPEKLPGPEEPAPGRSLRPIVVAGLVGLLMCVALDRGDNEIISHPVPSDKTEQAAQTREPVSGSAKEQFATASPAAPVKVSVPLPVAPVVTENKPAQPPPETSAADVALARLYTAHGDEMLAKRDISAARKFYEFAAGAGSAHAALALAHTYDPAFLEQYGVVGLHADPAMANIWYRRAALLTGPSAVAQAEVSDAKLNQITPADHGAVGNRP